MECVQLKNTYTMYVWLLVSQIPSVQSRRFYNNSYFLFAQTIISNCLRTFTLSGKTKLRLHSEQRYCVSQEKEGNDIVRGPTVVSKRLLINIMLRAFLRKEGRLVMRRGKCKHNKITKFIPSTFMALQSLSISLTIQPTFEMSEKYAMDFCPKNYFIFV